MAALTLPPVVLLTGLLLAASSRADVFVIASAEAPLQAISPKELQALYMGKRQALSDGLRVQATDLPRNHPLRERFYGQLTGMSLAQVSSHWARLLFSGQSTPPLTLTDEASMLSYLKRTPAALGYSTIAPQQPSGLKVVMVLKTGADSARDHAP
jgi:hypothetical protein